jgi:hypothetical protein
MWLGKQLLESAIVKVQKWVPETWDYERLKDGGITSASSETSVVLYGSVDDNRRLFLTGDAGANGSFGPQTMRRHLTYHWGNSASYRYLTMVADEMLDPRSLTAYLVQFRPKTRIQDSQRSSRLPPRTTRILVRWFSTQFTRRGGRVIATQGTNKVFWGGFPKRDGYTNVEAIPFASQVEDYDS